MLSSEVHFYERTDGKVEMQVNVKVDRKIEDYRWFNYKAGYDNHDHAGSRFDRSYFHGEPSFRSLP
ncbi:hypothetical protein SBF1_20005 [Candidatus Desulfosporosinus infrequens]|uniref:Uncharacterized protein n=1 Tax=Candidatus Desulfosporosinus infrequens TaxID=2043169 RepID=A0A2U3KGW6_9FIRM|nr:hypothetical protein SBF1_20005 [Candidatus Desulfosporosinus infrequens]